MASYMDLALLHDLSIQYSHALFAPTETDDSESPT